MRRAPENARSLWPLLSGVARRSAKTQACAGKIPVDPIVINPVPDNDLTVKTTESATLTRKFEIPLATPTDLTAKATKDLSGALNTLLADVFALFLKTKNFHWHISGPHFRDYHLLLDEQAAQLLALTDDLAERVRKIGGTTLRSIGHISRLQRVLDNDADYVEPLDMLAELREDNQTLIVHLRKAHEVCDEHHDIATASLIENWVDEAERRVWFLFETTRTGTPRH